MCTRWEQYPHWADCTDQWSESQDSFHARAEKIAEDLTRERDEARAALGALWDADAGPRDEFIDTPEERLCKDDQRLRDAWLAARKVLGRGDGPCALEDQGVGRRARGKEGGKAVSGIPDIPPEERTCANCDEQLSQACDVCHDKDTWEERRDLFRARVEKIIEDLTRERDEWREDALVLVQMVGDWFHSAVDSSLNAEWIRICEQFVKMGRLSPMAGRGRYYVVQEPKAAKP